MERLTFDGNFCDIAQCDQTLFQCDGNCTEKQVWERLKSYEDTRLSPEGLKQACEIEEYLNECGSSIARVAELIRADDERRVLVLPDVKYCEQYGWQNITWDKKHGICAGSYNTREEAEKALVGME